MIASPSPSSPSSQTPVLRHKNYTVLGILVIFCGLIFGITIVKMTMMAPVTQSQHHDNAVAH